MSGPESTSSPTTAQPPIRPGMGFGRGGGFGGMGGGMVEKPKHFKQTMRILVGYLLPFWRSFLIALLCAVASTVFTIISPKILGNITNTVVDGYISEQVYDQITTHLPHGLKLPPGTTGRDILARMPASLQDKIPAAQREQIAKTDFSHRPTIDFSVIAVLAELLVGLYVVSSLFAYIQGWVMSGLSQKVTYRLRRDIAQKFNQLPLRYFDTRTHGEVLSRVTNDVDTVSQTLNQSLTQIVTSVTTIIGILVMMLTISWQMTLVALLVLPVSFSFVSLIIKRSQGYFMQQQATLGKINGHVEEMFAGHTIMKAFNGEEKSVKTFKTASRQLHDSAWKAQFVSGLLMPITMFVGNLGYGAVAVFGGWLAINGKIKIGDIQAFIQYMSQFNQPISQVANISNVLQSTAAAAERVFEFLDEHNEAPDPEHPLEIDKVRGEVEFEHVVFGYDQDKAIIKDFSAHIKPGQRVAIVGPTGAGKTTLVNLLMRFYEIDRGQILVDGINTRDMLRADVRKLFGMVLQDSWLFSGTIEENIAYGANKVSHRQVVAAAEAAHADHFIRALPGGYNLVLNEEADNISQGEKQLLTIARAMLADTPMLILDEATSSVDTRTETLIQQAMDRLMAGRTSFIIAHRLSTIRNADLILVLNEGNIVEQGTHQALLAKNGFYANLYNSQFEAGQEELLSPKKAAQATRATS